MISIKDLEKEIKMLQEEIVRTKKDLIKLEHLLTIGLNVLELRKEYKV